VKVNPRIIQLVIIVGIFIGLNLFAFFSFRVKTVTCRLENNDACEPKILDQLDKLKNKSLLFTNFSKNYQTLNLKPSLISLEKKLPYDLNVTLSHETSNLFFNINNQNYLLNSDGSFEKSDHNSALILILSKTQEEEILTNNKIEPNLTLKLHDILTTLTQTKLETISLEIRPDLIILKLKNNQQVLLKDELASKILALDIIENNTNFFNFGDHSA